MFSDSRKWHTFGVILPFEIITRHISTWFWHFSSNYHSLLWFSHPLFERVMYTIEDVLNCIVSLYFTDFLLGYGIKSIYFFFQMLGLVLTNLTRDCLIVYFPLLHIANLYFWCGMLSTWRLTLEPSRSNSRSPSALNFSHFNKLDERQSNSRQWLCEMG